MKLFTVHAPPYAGGSPAERAEAMAFVKEGFSWPALLVPPLWLLWHRMWWALLGWLLAAVAITVGGELVPGADRYTPAVAAALSLWFAVQANDFRRWSLDAKGWQFLGLASGGSREDSELSFYGRWLAGARPAQPRAAAPVPGSWPARREEPGIGLFPGP